MDDLAVLITRYILHYLYLEKSTGAFNAGYIADSHRLWQEIDRYPQVRWTIANFALKDFLAALQTDQGFAAVQQFKQEVAAKGISILLDTPEPEETIAQDGQISEEDIELAEWKLACAQGYVIITSLFTHQFPAGSPQQAANVPQVFWSVDDLRTFLTETFAPVSEPIANPSTALPAAAILTSAASDALGISPVLSAEQLHSLLAQPLAAVDDSVNSAVAEGDRDPEPSEKPIAQDVPDQLPDFCPSRSPVLDSRDWVLIRITTLLGYFLLKAIAATDLGNSTRKSDLSADPIEQLLSYLLPLPIEPERSVGQAAELSRSLDPGLPPNSSHEVLSESGDARKIVRADRHHFAKPPSQTTDLAQTSTHLLQLITDNQLTDNQPIDSQLIDNQPIDNQPIDSRTVAQPPEAFFEQSIVTSVGSQAANPQPNQPAPAQTEPPDHSDRSSHQPDPLAVPINPPIDFAPEGQPPDPQPNPSPNPASASPASASPANCACCAADRLCADGNASCSNWRSSFCAADFRSATRFTASSIQSGR